MKQKKFRFLQTIALLAIIVQFYSCEYDSNDLNTTTKDLSSSSNSKLGVKKLFRLQLRICEKHKKAY